ncbi:hypothetical protein [Rhodococcus triatomae]
MEIDSAVEIARLVVGALIPLSVAVLGWWASHETVRGVPVAQPEANREADFRGGRDSTGPEPSVCHFACIGRWKELSPVDMIGVKRRLFMIFAHPDAR